MLEVGRPYTRWLRKIEDQVNLADEDRLAVARLPFVVRNLEDGRQIVAPGDRSKDCYLVLDGYLYEHKAVGAQGRQIIHLHVPGDVADLPSLHSASPDYSLAALGPAVVAWISHASILAATRLSPALDMAFKIQSSACESMLRERIVSLGKRDAISRVAHTICELATRLQSVGLAQSLRFAISWTQADLADLTGISTVHTNRVIQELRRIGALDWGAKRIRIENWPLLMQIGEFSPAYLEVPSSTIPKSRRAICDR